MKRKNILYKYQTIINLVLLLILVLSCISLGVFIQPYLHEKYNSEILRGNFNNNCSDSNLVTTSECLNKKLKEFFYYNITNKGKELTIDELKQNGGVCKHYSNWYVKSFENLGYKSLDQDEVKYQQDNESIGYVTECRMLTSKDVSHIITIASNKDYYCILDQKDKICTRFA